MLEHGICFSTRAADLSSLFAPAPEMADTTLPHAVSLYYDFAGAIDNIYASLVAWLVLARDFGRVRLWADRAEFEVKDGGLCGLRKVARPGGFAHVDVYFRDRHTDWPTGAVRQLRGGTSATAWCGNQRACGRDLRVRPQVRGGNSASTYRPRREGRPLPSL